MASRFLPTLRRGRPAGMETKTLADRVRANSRSYSIPGQPYAPDWNVDRAVKEGFQYNPWVFRAVDVIASTAISLPIGIRQGDPIDGNWMAPRRDQSRLLFRLNRRANPWETAKVWRYRFWAQYLLSSKGVFIEVSRSRARSYALLTLLDPDLTDPIPTASSPVGAFRVRTPVSGAAQPWNDLPAFDPNDDTPNSVVWVRSPHPTMVHRGASPMEAAGLSVDLDRYARLYNRAYMQSGGRPDGVLMVKGQAEQEIIDQIEAKFNAGARAGRTTALQGDAMTYVDLSTNPRDMLWDGVMDRMKSEANITFGVPLSMLGDASGRTFDNADAEYGIFWEHRMNPLLALADDQMDVLTPGGYEDEQYLRHNTDKVWVLSRHAREEADRAAADLDRGAISIDDFRERIGLDRLDVPATRVLWVPPGRLAVGDDAKGHESDAQSAAESPQGGMAQPVDPAEAAQAGAAQGAAIASYNSQTNSAASRLRAVAGGAQGRSTGGGGFGLQTAQLPVEGLEGKEGGARDGGPETDPGPLWQ